jgi:hypothetical protein
MNTAGTHEAIRTPTVSVLMPVYNGERYLRDALESVLGQSWRDFEFVVVDDGSTDGTSTILAGYSDPRLRVLRTEHRGLISALNTGMAHCRAPLVARMDADDISYPERLERQLEFMQRHEGVAVVSCGVELLDECGRVVGRHPDPDFSDLLLALAGGNPIVHGSVMMRRSALPPAPVYRRPPEDYTLWIELMAAGRRFGCVPQTLYGFRIHTDRYSIYRAADQSRANVAAQRPLLERCERERDQNEPRVRAALTRGWGIWTASAYVAGLRGDAEAGRRKLLHLIRGRRWHGPLREAACYAVESLLWARCPWPQSTHLAWLRLRRAPSGQHLKSLLLTFPPAQWLANACKH